MKISGLLLALSLSIASAPVLDSAQANPVPVIFDTDMDNDVDDVMALAMIHALERRSIGARSRGLRATGLGAPWETLNPPPSISP